MWKRGHTFDSFQIIFKPKFSKTREHDWNRRVAKTARGERSRRGRVIADAATWVRQRDVCVAASAGNEAMLLQRARPRPVRARIPGSRQVACAPASLDLRRSVRARAGSPRRRFFTSFHTLTSIHVRRRTFAFVRCERRDEETSSGVHRPWVYAAGRIGNMSVLRRVRTSFKVRLTYTLTDSRLQSDFLRLWTSFGSKAYYFDLSWISATNLQQVYKSPAQQMHTKCTTNRIWREETI